jgi:hypothetical protein
MKRRSFCIRGPAYAVAALLAVTALPVGAVEPTGPVQVWARLVSVEPVSRPGRAPLEAVAELAVEVAAEARFESLALRVLDDHRQPIEGAVLDGKGRFRTVRVPMSGEKVHEILLEATAVGPKGPARDEIALRVPLGVSGFVPEDDGEIAAFPLEVRP